jgi:hypothetical protein
MKEGYSVLVWARAIETVMLMNRINKVYLLISIFSDFFKNCLMYENYLGVPPDFSHKGGQIKNYLNIGNQKHFFSFYCLLALAGSGKFIC